VSRILELVENSGDKKAKVENFITRFARYYTPIVCALALALAIVPPLIFGQMWESGCSADLFSLWCHAVRAGDFGADELFWRHRRRVEAGVLIKGSNYLEVLSKADTIVFDKTAR
jgi:Cd2+/Zn2+-exporting ATPase